MVQSGIVNEESSDPKPEVEIKKGKLLDLSFNSHLLPPFFLRLEFCVKNEDNQVHYKNLITAMVDLGSPISLIKHKYVPVSARLSVPHNNQKCFGINNCHLLKEFLKRK